MASRKNLQNAVQRKKTKENPAVTAVEALTEEAPSGSPELKTRRVQILVQPSVYENARIIMDALSRKRGERQTVNDYINKCLADFVDEHRDIIARYETAMKDI